jgi:hypothetical protein
MSDETAAIVDGKAQSSSTNSGDNKKSVTSTMNQGDPRATENSPGKELNTEPTAPPATTTPPASTGTKITTPTSNATAADSSSTLVSSSTVGILIPLFRVMLTCLRLWGEYQKRLSQTLPPRLRLWMEKQKRLRQSLQPRLPQPVRLLELSQEASLVRFSAESYWL